MGTGCSATSLRRDPEEVAVTGAGGMGVRCKVDFLVVTEEQAAGVVTTVECVSLLGTIRALNPTGSWV